MIRPSTKFIIRLSVGILLVILLFFFVSPSSVFQSLRSANPFFLICAVMVYALAFLLLTARWRNIVAHMGGYIPFSEAYQAFAGGVLYSDFTPGRIGDFTRAILVKGKIGIHKGTVSVFIDRYIDIIVLTGLGIAAIVIYSSRFASILPILALIVLLVVFSGVTVLFLGNSWIFSLMQKIPFFNIPEITSQLQNALLELKDGKKVIAEGIILTVTGLGNPGPAYYPDHNESRLHASPARYIPDSSSDQCPINHPGNHWGSRAGRGRTDGGYCRVWSSLVRCIVDCDTGPGSYHALSFCCGWTGCGEKYSTIAGKIRFMIMPARFLPSEFLLRYHNRKNPYPIVGTIHHQYVQRNAAQILFPSWQHLFLTGFDRKIGMNCPVPCQCQSFRCY